MKTAGYGSNVDLLSEKNGKENARTGNSTDGRGVHFDDSQMS